MAVLNWRKKGQREVGEALHSGLRNNYNGRRISAFKDKAEI